MSTSLFFFICVYVFFLGAILGSFLNVLLFRFNTGRGYGGRSACMRCGRVLGALDLVPIFSYLFLRGRCGACGVRISPQYPLVELAAALLSLGVYLLHPEPLLYMTYLALWLTILFIVVYDLRHTIIPWSASGLLAALALLQIFLPQVLHVGVGGVTSVGLWSLLAGPLLAFPLFALSFVSRGRWMGWGDSPFMLSLGWLLGLADGATALLLAVWSGALVGLLLIVLSKRVTIRSEIPFAPFLAFGAAIVFFFHGNLFTTAFFF